MALDEFSIPSCVKDAIKEAGYTANTSMEGFISTWWQWYTGTTQWYDEGYTTVEGRKKTRRRMSIRPARRVCREWASLILNEGTTITCEGAKAVRPTRSAVSTKILPTAADTACRGAVWVPASLREI